MATILEMQSNVVELNTSFQQLLSGGNSTDITISISSLRISNNTDNPLTYSLDLSIGGATAIITQDAFNIPGRQSVVVYSASNGKLYLKGDASNPDVLRAKSSAASGMVVEFSYVEETKNV